MPDPYMPRTVDAELDALLPGLPAIAVEGVRGVGKTATCTQRARTVYALEHEGALETLRADVSLLTRVPGPVLVDEWQRLPATWDTVRRCVDDGAPAGRFLLTGSALPGRDVPIHTGAGRIASIHMRPMALFERPGSPATVSLGGLLRGEATVDGDCAWRLEDYAQAIVASGLPGIMSLPEAARRRQIATYLDRVVDRDVPAAGVTVRRRDALTTWLRAYAAATSTTANYTTILKAATPGGGDQPARSTVDAYRSVLTRLWLLDPVPSWNSSWRPLAYVAAAPKHHLADPAFAASLLGVTTRSLVSGRAGQPGRSIMGQLFESLATLSVRVAAQAQEAQVGHVRTKNGEHEIDLVVEGLDGALVAVEVKLTGAPRDGDVAHLLWLKDILGDALTDMVILTTGTNAYRRRDGVAVVPLALLAA